MCKEARRAGCTLSKIYKRYVKQRLSQAYDKLNDLQKKKLYERISKTTYKKEVKQQSRAISIDKRSKINKRRRKTTNETTSQDRREKRVKKKDRRGFRGRESL